MENRQSNIIRLLKRLTEQVEVTVHEVKINDESGKLNGLTIAQISDLHITNFNVDLIEHTIEVLNRLKPDIVTMTGDAICNGKKYLPHLKALLKEIDSKYGNFACIGNHDHSDGEDSLAIQNTYNNANFQVLKNNSTKVNVNGETIYLAGADDIELGEQNIITMAQDIPIDATSVFLTHNPINFNQLAKLDPDLVLAGHTHGGQIFPAISKVLYKLIYGSDYVSGFYTSEKSKLYVNRGIGTAILSPLVLDIKLIINTPRIFSRPEISLFKIVSDSKDGSASKDKVKNS